MDPVKIWYEQARELCMERGDEVAAPWDDLLPFNQQFIRNMYQDNAVLMNRMVLNTSYSREYA